MDFPESAKIEILHRLLVEYPLGLLCTGPEAESIGEGWNYRALSSHQHLSSEYVTANPDKDWQYLHLLTNIHVNIEAREIVLKYLIDNNMLHTIDGIMNQVKDLPMIKALLKVHTHNYEESLGGKNFFEVEDLCNDNYSMDLESLQWLYNHDQYGKLVDLRDQYQNENIEVLRWLMEIGIRGWENLVDNAHIDGEMIVTLLKKLRRSDEQDPHDKDFSDRMEVRHSIMLRLHRYRLTEEAIIYILGDPWLERFLNPETISDLLSSEACTPEISRMTFREYPEIINGETVRYNRNRISEKIILDEVVLDEIFQSESINVSVKNILTLNKAVTPRIIENLINGEYPDISVDDNTLSDIISTYYANLDTVDIPKLEELKVHHPNLGELIGLINSASDSRPSTISWKAISNRWRQYVDGSWERTSMRLIPVIHDLDSLKKLKTINYTKIELGTINDEIMEWIQSHKNICDKIEWLGLTKTVDHYYIIHYPDLPWNASELSRREYYPSIRGRNTKPANKK